MDDPEQDADRNNHSGMLMVGTEPLMRWAMCEGGAKPEWIATVIRTEMNAPFQGEVDGVRQADTAIQTQSKGVVNESRQAAPAGHMHMK